MRCSKAVVYFDLFALLYMAGGKQINTRLESSAGNHELMRQRRTFGSTDPPCGMTHGVYLERWDRIDFKRVKFLLMDPRYPNLPSVALCVPTFEQPQKWANFFGARMRTYFVPLQTGNHYFYLSSDAGSELFLSTNEKPDSKTQISGVGGGFATYPYEYDRYANQKSLPISLKKGKYYYMETIMKDDYQSDHLEVGLKTPDGTFYRVIPSKFLWTTPPLPYAENATYQAILLKIAAEAGTKAGLSFGARFAMKSGAKAGAKAGAMAGMKAGASAGADAGVRAAIQMTTSTLQDAMNKLHGDNIHKFKINVDNGEVVSVTGPGMEGASRGSRGEGAAVGTPGAGGTAGTAGAGGAGGAAGTAGTAGTVGSGGNAGTGGTPGAAGAGGSAGGAAVGAAGAGRIGGASAVITGAGSVASGGAVTAGGAAGGGANSGSISGITGGSQVTSTGGAAGAGVVGGGVGAGVGAGGSEPVKEEAVEGEQFSPDRPLTYIPKPGEDPQAKALELVWKAGGARKIVANGMYTFHSFNLPYFQEDFALNLCWRSINGKFVFDRWCQVFIARVPALYKTSKKENTVSFESACFPGYFMRQKNYRFILQKRDGSELFDKDSSFNVYSVMKYSRNFLFNAMHKDWYICQADGKRKFRTGVILDFYNGEPDVLDRCTALLRPIEGDKLMNCRRALGPLRAPEINGQPLPHPPHLVETTPAPPFVLPPCLPICTAGGTGATSVGPPSARTSVPSKPGQVVSTPSTQKCVALNFMNKLDSPFKLYSSIKHERYFVTGSGVKLKLIIVRPEVHSHVTFHAEDPYGERKILLNGRQNISEPVVSRCTTFRDVTVTAEPGLFPKYTTVPRPSVTTSSTPARVPPTPPQSGATPLSPSSPPTPPSVSSSPALSPPVPPPQAPPHPPAQTPPHPPAQTPSVVFPGAASSPSGNGSVHYHYHYHGSKTLPPVQVCPASCTDSAECLSTCPVRCCKRDMDEFIDDDGFDTSRKRDCLCTRKCKKLETKRNTRKRQCILSCSRSCKHKKYTSVESRT